MKLNLLLSAAAVALCHAPAAAVTIGHGDCDDVSGGGTVVYEDVTESNAGPAALYNAPTCIQNLIDFDPTDFQAFDDDGETNATADSIFGELAFSVRAVSGMVLTRIGLSEGGDRQVLGSGSGTRASATMSVALAIHVSDGLGGTLAVDFEDEQSVLYQLPGDSSFATLSWGLDAEYDLAAILDDACQGQGAFAGQPVAEACGAGSTRVDVTVGNLLEALAEGGSDLAFVNKKDTDSLSVTTDTVPVPEPGTAGLLGLGMAGVALGRRGRG